MRIAQRIWDAVNSCLVSIKYKNSSVKYILKIHLSNWDLDSMIPKAISQAAQTWTPNPKCKKEITNSRDNLMPYCHYSVWKYVVTYVDSWLAASRKYTFLQDIIIPDITKYFFFWNILLYGLTRHICVILYMESPWAPFITNLKNLQKIYMLTMPHRAKTACQEAKEIQWCPPR